MDIGILAEHNPWWVNGIVPPQLKGLPRRGYDLLLRSIEIREVTIISGVRRAGKSTLMYQMIDHLLSSDFLPEQILFINLEDPRLQKGSVEEFYTTYRNQINPVGKTCLFLDEIHRQEGWEGWVRRMYDLHSDIKFTVSGSCSYLLKTEYSRLLTGRNLSFEVFPLSFQEYLEFSKVEVDGGKLRTGIMLDTQRHQIMNSLNKYISGGGFPAVFFREAIFKSPMLQQYYDDILYKDVVDRYNINGKNLKELSSYLITNFTRPYSLRSLRGALGLSYDAIKDYLSYLIDAYLIFTVEYFAYSLKERRNHNSKIYCIDNGLRNAVSFKFSKDEGKLVENLVFLELKRRGFEIFYWSQKGEVDFVIKHQDQSLTAINVPYGESIPEREYAGLMEFEQSMKKSVEKILITRNLEGKLEGIVQIPLWKWLFNPEKSPRGNPAS